MGFILLIVVLMVVVTIGPSKPKIAISAYYLMSVMAPQAIWPWIFDGLPTFKIVAGTLILTFIFSVLTKKIDFSAYRDKQSVALLFLFLFVHLGHLFSPFQLGGAATSIDVVLGTFNIIVLMYFISIPFLTNEHCLKWFTATFIVVVLYYVYWSNNEYFSYSYANFYKGRLMGPFGSPYRDENKFSVLFVVGMPFLLFGFFFAKKNIYKVAAGVALLLLWHSVFLTGSRGALLATAVATLFAYTQIKSRLVGMALILGFAVVVIDQGAQSIQRTTDTVEHAKHSDEAIDPRISSWTAGLGFIAEHPLFGVGVTRFRAATIEYYPEKEPYVAHNTLINIAAESGVISGAIFIYFYVINFLRFRLVNKQGIENYPFLDYLNKSTMTALTGFYVTAIFLDLLIYEVFYVLLMLTLAKHLVFIQFSKAAETQPVTVK